MSMERKRLANTFAAFSLFLLLSMPLLSAICTPAQRNIYLAAVTGENAGGVFQLHVEVKPGSGNTYMSINPKTGFSTQESEDTAASYGFSSTGINRTGCDVLFSMAGDFGGNSVDGPSAGGAMAAATRAALLNLPLRQDAVMTGTISPEGKVGAVGGIIEKGIGAEEAGAKYFITPKLKVHEALLLSSLSRTKDFHTIEVENLSEAEEILFSNYSTAFTSRFNPTSVPLPASLPGIKADADLGRFSLVAKKIVNELRLKLLAAYPPGDEGADTAKLHAYFDKEAAKYSALLPMGYVFTSANSAFLLSIDLEYARIGDKEVDLNGSIDDVKACIASIPDATMTRENAHWAIGSHLRKAWAIQRLNQTLEARADQGGYTTLRDLLFVSSWCGISRELAAQASDIGGEPANESLLASLSSKELILAQDAFSNSKKIDYDAMWHLQNAELANGTGAYGASIYESAYALSMQSAGADNVENMSASTAKLVSATYGSLWGKIYAGHGEYLYYESQDNGFPPNDAYKTLKYSQELDRVAQEMDSALANPAAAQGNGTRQAGAQGGNAAQGNARNCSSAATAAGGNIPGGAGCQPASQFFSIAVSLLAISLSLIAIYRLTRKWKGWVQ